MIEAPFQFETGAASHTGKVRDHNEDSFLVQAEAGVWLVADGMGGHEAGDFASRSIAESVASIGLPVSAPDLQARFMDRLLRAHQAIQGQSQRMGGATVGATLVALLTFERHFACIWSGDSRIYLMRQGQFQQVTVDHTEVQELLRTGAITPEQAASWPRRNVITRAIGVADRPMTDERSGLLADGDTFLLCSDGLTEHVQDHEMATVLAGHGAQGACEALIDLTLARGARDNVTVVIVRCRDRQGAHPGAVAGGAGHRAAPGRDEWHVEG
ncbi:MAG: protein phosphatase 2C domain-containing protein [Paracoccaceae bacterium]